LWTAGPVTGAEVCRARHDYDEIAAAATERFYDRTFRGLDWPARVRHHRNKVRCNDSEERVAIEVNALLAELHASHTALYTQSDIHYWGLNSLFAPRLSDFALNFTGIWPQRRGQQWYAKYVLEGSPAARAGVRQGDHLVLLNGEAFSPLAFTGKADLLVTSSDGRARRDIPIRAAHVSIMQAFIDASNASRTTFTRQGKRVAYFHLWTARDEILQSLQAAIAELDAGRVDGFILDFRGGYGGTSPDYLAPLRASAHLMSVPKVFLIDDGVRSGKEMLAAMVRKERLGTLVGSRTAGGFLGAVPVRLLDDRYFLLVAAYGAIPLDLPTIEGVGVQPDVRVAPCRMRCAGRDPQLEKALELLTGVSAGS
jgi:carboxyl-terminal processing protease